MLPGVCELLPEPVTATDSTQELLCVRLVRPRVEPGATARLWQLNLREREDALTVLIHRFYLHVP